MPRFDISCRTCGGDSEIQAPDISILRCGCGSIDVERLWTAPPMFVMKGDPNGSTPVVRKHFIDLNDKFTEADRKKAGTSHENTKVIW